MDAERHPRRRATACLAISAGIALFAASPAPAHAATPAEVAALASAPCPERDPVRGSSFSATVLANAKQGEFAVMKGLPATLLPPVDWTQDPYRARSWTHYLHAFNWITPLHYLYLREGDLDALAQARDLVLDWIASNPYGASGLSPQAWNDKGTGERAIHLAFIARAAACEGLLTEAEMGTLIDAARHHATFLRDPVNHRHHNHALFVHLGLAYLGDQFSFLAEGPPWSAEGRRRFVATLRRGVDPVDWLWLEHSSGYHFLAIRLVNRFSELLGHNEALEPYLAGMRSAARWLVMPNGSQVPIGDSVETRAPGWARGAEGMKVMRGAGLAVVGDGGGYLAITAGFHSRTHKHKDDLGFHLYDRGRGIITDSGHFSYDLDKWRRFSSSVEAHSVLTVDGREFPTYDASLAYGSGIIAAGRGRGWYAILATNPLLRRQKVRHRRLFLYRPGRALLVFDRVRAKRRHTYRRYFQIGSGLRAKAGRRRVKLRAPGFRGALVTAGHRARTRAVTGRYTPPAGWSFPGFRRREPRTTVKHRSRRRNADYLAAFGLRGGIDARLLGEGGTRIAVSGASVKRARVLGIKRHGGRLTITRRRR